jgi:hypothetical protein
MIKIDLDARVFVWVLLVVQEGRRQQLIRISVGVHFEAVIPGSSVRVESFEVSRQQILHVVRVLDEHSFFSGAYGLVFEHAGGCWATVLFI